MSSFVNKVLLFPYYITLKIRDYLYKSGHKKSYTFDTPIISIGNITVGGTGKTPHTEMFVKEFLSQNLKVAVVSRGYGRKTKQCITVGEYHKYSDVGDEPLQIKRKFPEATVIVDKDRKHAIDLLLSNDPENKPDIIILDDAFQYRRVVPSRQIVLINYHRPIFKDSLLPFGRLRDLPERISDADTIIITKCPPYMNEWEKEKCKKINRIPINKPIFFTSVNYGNLLPIFQKEANNRFMYSQSAILVTGIANGNLLKDYLLTKYSTIYFLEFGDHHKYTKGDIKKLDRIASKHPRSLIITTEKDTQRLIFNKYITQQLKERSFYIPIQVNLVEKEETTGLFDFSPTEK